MLKAAGEEGEAGEVVEVQEDAANPNLVMTKTTLIHAHAKMVKHIQAGIMISFHEFRETNFFKFLEKLN